MKMAVNELPIIESSDSGFNIKFDSLDDEGTKMIPVEIICDFNLYKDLIGIEILNFTCFAGRDAFRNLGVLIANPKEPRIRLTVPGDNFYFDIKNDRSLDQLAVNGHLVLSEPGYLVSISGSCL
jgi:hypothetical protein